MEKWSTRGFIFSALFAAILIALSYVRIPLPFTQIPITFQTLAIMLAGSILGARYGTIAVLLVIGLAAVGFPVLGGKAGIPLLVGPTAGFIFSFPIATLLIGFFARRIRQDRFTIIKLVVINFVFGSLCLYPLGVAWLAHVAHITSLSKALTVGMWPFLPGDIIKTLICAGAVTSVWRVYPMERIVGGRVVEG